MANPKNKAEKAKKATARRTPSKAVKTAAKATKTRNSAKKTKADKLKIAEKICKDYESGEFTIESCCNEHGISVRTFNNYVGDIAEIAVRYKKAKDKHAKINKEGIREKALDGFKRLLTGFHVEEEEVEEMFDKNGRPSGRRVKRKKKYFAPQTAAVIFALKNTDPNNWSDQLNIEFNEEQVFKIGDNVIKFQ